MKSHPASINDIAKALGISASTVSRALRDHPDISADTRLRVREYALKVNYRPNALALGLKHQRSNTIGIIVPEIVHHFFSSIISGIEDFAYARGYRIMICQSNEDQAREKINTQALLDHRVDGILVSHSKSTLDFTHFHEASESQIPIVFIDRFCKELDTDRVITDDFQGAKLITRYLIGKDRNRILHLSAPQHLLLGKERCRGYVEALMEANIQINEDRILLCDTPAKVMAAREHILGLAGDTDGIFAVNDFTAVTVMKILQEAGYSIPRDISVVGFGNDPVAGLVSPGLTTVEQKGYDMGREAVKMLVERIEAPESNPASQTKVFPVRLIERNSA